MSTRTATRLLRPASQATYEKVFGTVYVGLMVNVLLAVACAPLLAALAIVRDPVASWPFFLALSGVCAPALAGAFSAFGRIGEDGVAQVLRPFWSAYARTAGRALAVWAVGALLVGVLVVDALLLVGTVWGPVLVPFFVTTSALVVTVVVGMIALAVEHPGARLRDLVRPCLYLMVRRWYLAAANAVVLGLAVTIILLTPVLGMLVACSPLLYVVWANTRYALAPLQATDGGHEHADPPHRLGEEG